MVIDITNTCRMGCRHCMQCSTPDPQHMDDETFQLARNLALMTRVHVIVVAGGEPTEHPHWDAFVRTLAQDRFKVVVATNGMWMGSDKEGLMLDILEEFKNVFIQMTTVAGLYPRHFRTLEQIDELKRRMKDRGLKHRLMVAEHIESMLALGRCCDHPDLVEMAERNEESTTRCFQGALVSAQVSLEEAVATMESRGKFCRPIVDWHGFVHWSESWLCQPFASVREPFRQICEKAHAWRPCGKCLGYQKLLRKRDPKYVIARRILGVENGQV